ncbi:MAG: hypothetical protein OXC11_02015 [Rhodospirillales bacterium]|nr:hypothetical protein [Rhodospirillales bacterium]
MNPLRRCLIRPPLQCSRHGFRRLATTGPLKTSCRHVGVVAALASAAVREEKPEEQAIQIHASATEIREDRDVEVPLVMVTGGEAPEQPGKSVVHPA